MISSKKYVDETLKKYHLKANKALGQNFLVESQIAQEIVDQMGIEEDTIVIEIGPGLGSLTEILVTKAKAVYAFEIDEHMVEILKDVFSSQSNLTIIHEDFLKVDLPQFLKELKEKNEKDIRLISNLPYYITSKLLNKILIKNENISCVVAMMQKEVGQKIVRSDGKDKNVLSMTLDYQYDVKIIKYVSKNAYLPRPDIDSVVLKFQKIAPRYACDEEIFLKVCSALFQNRRKTILNNLKVLFKTMDDLNQCLFALNLLPSYRIEQLKVQDIVGICHYIEKMPM